LENTIGYKYMIIRKCKKLAKLDNEDVTPVDRDLAKNFEIMNDSEMRPNTSVGIQNYNNKKEEFFPSENQADIKDENIKNLDENNKKIEEKEEINIEVDTQLKIENIKEENISKIEENFDKKNSETVNIQNLNLKMNNNKNTNNKNTKNESMSTIAIKDKIISQVEYPSKNKVANKNKNV